MVDFSTRSSKTEIMDDLLISGEVIPQTLKELEIINKFLGGNSVTLSGINDLLRNRDLKDKELRIADMGCGGGDMLKLIAKWAYRRDLKVKLTGIDANASIIDYARNNTKDYTNIDYHAENVFNQQNHNSEFDIIISTLFLHHFDDKESSFLLKDWQNRSWFGVVINDLHRHPLAYHSIKLLTRLLSKSYMVKNDGPLSVMRAFRKNDLIKILKQAGIRDYSLVWKWAFRWKLVIYSNYQSG